MKVSTVMCFDFVRALCAIMEGDWENGKMSGHGIYKSSHGNVYDGEWRNNKKHGRGVYKCVDGSAYEGRVELIHP
jgi:hypothetical protein